MWHHPWDAHKAPPPQSNRPRRDPRTQQLQQPGSWSNTGAQIVGAAQAAGSKAFSATPTPSSARGNAYRQLPENQPASGPPAMPPVLRAEEGPFDPMGEGERRVAQPAKHALPEALRYPQCQTAVPLPTNFDPALIQASARPPVHELRKAPVGGVCGYSGAGVHARAPNILALPLPPSGVVPRGAHNPPKSEAMYAAGRMCVIVDVATHQQRCYTQHTQLVSCVAMHPNGLLCASAQLGSAAGGTHAYASVWELGSLQELSRVGWTHAADGGPGSGGLMTPCFTRSICALAFTPVRRPHIAPIEPKGGPCQTRRRASSAMGFLCCAPALLCASSAAAALLHTL